MRPLVGAAPEPPADVRSGEFREWCRALRRRGYATRLIAEAAGTSERRVVRAINVKGREES